MNLTRITLAALASVMAVSAVSCAGKDKKGDQIIADNSGISDDTPADPIRGQTIVWLGDYDLNPSEDEERSNALAVFEDYYGGKIRYVRTSREDRFNALDGMINSGEQVDFFPYEDDVFPAGIAEGRFQPLDPYYDTLGMSDGIWQNMTGIIRNLACDGQHYIVPYSISDPMIVTYSRKLVKELEMDDPYELYQQGKWDWDAMMSMMETFTAGAEKGKTRYGIAGVFGEALINSTGHGVVEWDGAKAVSMLDSDELAKAGAFMEDIAAKKLYRRDMIMCYPADGSTLFFAAGDWSLGDSNAQSPDSDLMVVPFPTAPGAKTNSVTCRFNAKMLVKNSTKGEAVAAYIRCERMAATEKTYIEAAKKEALVSSIKAPGVLKSFITEEQYDAIRSYCDPNKVNPIIDCGYGMGRRMSGGTGLTFEQRGVMEKIDTVLLEGDAHAADWAALCDICRPVINEELEKINK